MILFLSIFVFYISILSPKDFFIQFFGKKSSHIKKTVLVSRAAGSWRGWPSIFSGGAD